MRIYNYITSTKTLGPYNRFALWVQGCLFDCKGCMTPDAQNLEGGVEIDIQKLATLINSTKEIEGITITGGEPFLQVEELNRLLELVDKRLGVIVYTGYRLEELRDKSDINIDIFLDKIDILIDGLYVENLNDNTALKGSSNQNIYQLSDRYKDVFDRYYNTKKREIEIHINQDDLMIVGIPTKKSLEKLELTTRRYR